METTRSKPDSPDLLGSDSEGASLPPGLASMGVGGAGGRSMLRKGVVAKLEMKK
jgi:hypothetical protein